MATDGNSPQALGFLTVVSDPELGLLGGYLALNAAGRPLEFHCTAPVKANRAQEILYGTALSPYLHGELIGGALAGRAKTPPLVICTDQAPTLAVRAVIDCPVALILPEGSEDAQPTVPASRLAPFRMGDHRAAVDPAFPDDQRIIAAAAAGPFADFDFAEPFARIREALQEARPTGPAATKPVRQAAAA